MKDKEIYEISIEAYSKSDISSINGFLLNCKNIPLSSVRNYWLDGVAFDFQGSEEEAKELLKLLCSKYKILLNYFRRKHQNWFQMLFCKEDK